MMKCILHITRSDVERTRCTFDTRESSTSCHREFEGTLRCWFERLVSKMKGQVVLVDTKESRLTFGVEQKRERPTFDERTYNVGVHSVIVPQK